MNCLKVEILLRQYQIGANLATHLTLFEASPQLKQTLPMESITSKVDV